MGPLLRATAPHAGMHCRAGGAGTAHGGCQATAGRMSQAHPRQERGDQGARTKVLVLQGKEASLRRTAPRRTLGRAAVRAFCMRRPFQDELGGEYRHAPFMHIPVAPATSGASAAGIRTIPARFSVKARAYTLARTLERRLGLGDGTPRGSGAALRQRFINRDLTRLGRSGSTRQRASRYPPCSLCIRTPPPA